MQCKYISLISTTPVCISKSNVIIFFQKIIAHFTGTDVGQMFKKEVVIKNLPTLQLLKQRDKTPSLIETEGKDIGLSNLFTSPGT